MSLVLTNRGPHPAAIPGTESGFESLLLLSKLHQRNDADRTVLIESYEESSQVCSRFMNLFAEDLPKITSDAICREFGGLLLDGYISNLAYGVNVSTGLLDDPFDYDKIANDDKNLLSKLDAKAVGTRFATWFFGIDGTFFAFHLEDCDATLAYVLRYGASKIWIYQIKCENSLRHKNLFVLLGQPEVNKTPFQMFKQQVGDIMILPEDVFHE